MKNFTAFLSSVVLVVLVFVTGSDGLSQEHFIPANNKGITEVISARRVTEIPTAISESSGIAVSTPNHIWSQNDAGNTNEIFCFDTTGNLLRQLLITNALNIDWEDLTVDDQKRMYINDAGNNENDRKDLRIYRIPNPETIAGNSVQAEVINFTLEDQVQFPPPNNDRNYDIEAIIWKNDSLYLFTKNRSNPQSGICKLYNLPAKPGTFEAKLLDAIFLGNTNEDARVTSADINPSTGELLLLTGTKIVSFVDYPANRFFDGKTTFYYFSNTVGQVEGVAFVGNSRLFLIEEGNTRSSGYLYEVKWKYSSDINESILEKISLFPNPVIGYLSIEVPFEREWMVEIFDVEGKLVMQNQPVEKQLALQHLSPGIYFVSLSLNNESLVRRIIKK